MANQNAATTGGISTPHPPQHPVAVRTSVVGTPQRIPTGGTPPLATGVAVVNQTTGGTPQLGGGAPGGTPLLASGFAMANQSGGVHSPASGGQGAAGRPGLSLSRSLSRSLSLSPARSFSLSLPLALSLSLALSPARSLSLALSLALTRGVSRGVHAVFFFFFITLEPRVDRYTSLRALNTSPPRNRCTFHVVSRVFAPLPARR